MGIQYFGRGSVTSAAIADDSITDSDINTAAAISYSKLDLADSIVDADIAAHTSTKITITDKGQLNSAIMYTDASNTIADAVDFAFNTTTGSKFGTAVGQKIGFYNAAPVAQGASIADIAVDANGTAIAAAVNALISRLEDLGFIATV